MRKMNFEITKRCGNWLSINATEDENCFAFDNDCAAMNYANLFKNEFKILKINNMICVVDKRIKQVVLHYKNANPNCCYVVMGIGK